MTRTVRVIPAGQWPDSRAEQRAHWRFLPPAERVQAGRELQRRVFWWMHGRPWPGTMERVVRVFRPGR